MGKGTFLVTIREVPNSMNIVIYVCHVDDDILGSGGLIPQMIEAGHNVGVVYATDASTPRAYDSAKRSMARNAVDVLGVSFGERPFLRVPRAPIRRTGSH